MLPPPEAAAADLEDGALWWVETHLAFLSDLQPDPLEAVPLRTFLAQRR